MHCIYVPSCIVTVAPVWGRVRMFRVLCMDTAARRCTWCVFNYVTTHGIFIIIMMCKMVGVGCAKMYMQLSWQKFLAIIVSTALL